MLIEQPGIETQNPPQADIFLAEKPETIYLPSRNLQLRSQLLADMSHDILISKTALILQAGTDQHGEPFDIDKKAPDDRVLSLAFDVSRQKEGIFGWEISKSDRTGRTIRQLAIDNGKKYGRMFRLDQQGSLRQESDLSEEDCNIMAAEIVYLVDHKLTLKVREALYTRKKIIQTQLGIYAVERTMGTLVGWKDHPSKYKKRMEKFEKMIAKVGYSPSAFYKPPQSTR